MEVLKEMQGRIGTYIDVDAQHFANGQDPRGLVVAFFRHSERIRISNIRVVDRLEIHRLEPITIRPVALTAPEFKGVA